MHGITIALQCICDRLPAGTIGERAMDKHDILDSAMSDGH
jgi:hypothetical protein